MLQILREEYKVDCVVANRPVYEVHPFVRRHAEGQHLPLSEELGRRLFCPPTHPLMTHEQNEYICAAIVEAVERVREER